MKFFRIDTNSGKEYFVALSEKHMRDMLGTYDNIKSYVNFAFGKLETLIEVDQKEASQTRDYKFFLKSLSDSLGLCDDGTYSLGLAGQPEEPYNPHHLYLETMYSERN